MEIIVGIGIGLLLGYAAFWAIHRYRTGGFESLSRQIIEQAEQDAASFTHKIELQLKEKEVSHQIQLDRERSTEKEKFQREEARLQKREDKLEVRMSLVEQKLSQVEKREAAIALRKELNDKKKEEVAKLSEKVMANLEKVSGMTRTEAKELLFDQVINEVRQETLSEQHRMRKEAQEDASKEAARIITTAINRLAVSCTSESTTHTVSLPSSDLKGRVIGREGRNIRLLEKLTGVNFLIDDTPNTVVISGFDQIRLYTAKIALTQLVEDGRIHPTSIEESVTLARESIDMLIIRAGEEAAIETAQTGLHEEIIKLLGGLKFRHSLGQNILEHSIEVSHLMGMIAAELGLDIKLAKRIGLLHDMGKAAAPQYEGTHALVGKNLALKYNESPEVANGIGCHHYEIEPITIEGSFCAAADAISASRPGARLEAIHQYMQRLKNLEEIAYGFPGIEKAYAMQAGREVVISVLPEMIDDHGARNLARDITKKIKSEVHYTGKIKVTVLREQRIVEYAS